MARNLQIATTVTFTAAMVTELAAALKVEKINATEALKTVAAKLGVDAPAFAVYAAAHDKTCKARLRSYIMAARKDDLPGADLAGSAKTRAREFAYDTVLKGEAIVADNIVANAKSKATEHDAVKARLERIIAEVGLMAEVAAYSTHATAALKSLRLLHAKF